jgi:hypothetical protein
VGLGAFVSLCEKNSPSPPAAWRTTDAQVVGSPPWRERPAHETLWAEAFKALAVNQRRIVMWDLVIDLLWPSKSVKSVERIAEKASAGTLPVEWERPEAFKRALNESGWLADEVIAAGLVTQGKPQSLFRMITGLALLEVLRPRRSKSLPREFALAVTADRVVAFAMSPWKEGDGETVRVVKIKHEERGSWSHALVRMVDASKGRVQNGATLDLAGEEQIPVTWDGDPSTDELVELLAR